MKQSEIELCEAGHLGLTLQEKHEYDHLVEEARWRVYCESNTCNDHTRKASYEAINRILAFEKEHGIKG